MLCATRARVWVCVRVCVREELPFSHNYLQVYSSPGKQLTTPQWTEEAAPWRNGLRMRSRLIVNAWVDCATTLITLLTFLSARIVKWEQPPHHPNLLIIKSVNQKFLQPGKFYFRDKTVVCEIKQCKPVMSPSDLCCNRRQSQGSGRVSRFRQFQLVLDELTKIANVTCKKCALINEKLPSFSFALGNESWGLTPQRTSTH